jgi:hypothetical protein
MFSTITIALSTSSPSERIKLKRTTIFSVNPITLRTIMLARKESGIATATRRALLIPITSSSTRNTSTNPLKILFSRSFTIL